MTISTIIAALEAFAPPAYQESYDNSGLIIGNASAECTGILCTLDSTEEVVNEAISKGCNLIIAHHPIVFGGLKKITGKNYVERTVIAAIKNDIAIYAIHTNADNVIKGVNNKMSDALGLKNKQILAPKSNLISKLVTFIPLSHLEQVRTALFENGAGNIGNYSEASYSVEGTGTYKANEGANPFLGEIGFRHEEQERKLEVIFPNYIQSKLLNALKNAHPYEEVAYDIITLNNENQEVGSGMIGELEIPTTEEAFLGKLKEIFKLDVIRHTPLLGKKISKVALCGGSGSFLTKNAINAKADIFVTADVKYHEFFDADKKLIIADIGHWESEQFTTDLLFDILHLKFPTFAVLKSEVITNSVKYFIN